MSAGKFLDCARSPLQKGVTLIEASAGTGKTYAIAMLVLRAITELEVPIDRILVVTFTKAATEELRGRIRQRLSQARDLLDGGSSDDATIAAWLETVANPERTKKLLQLALYNIDTAGIFTIHSFCQRMLSEQALESDQLFDVELLADVDRIRGRVVEDYWRRHIYTLAPGPCGVLMGKYPDPQKLYQSISGAGSVYSRLEPACSTVEQAVKRFDGAYGALAGWWRSSSSALFAFFSQARDEGKLKKAVGEGLEDWWQSLDDYFSRKSCNLPENLGYLTAAGLREGLNGNKVRKNKQEAYLEPWPLPSVLADEFSAASDEMVIAFRRELVVAVRMELEHRLQEQGNMSFDDLIVRLDRAIAGEGAGLQSLLGDRFRVALIDEFQDTDSAQWRIFSSLFGGGDHCLYLIGDPKQAIYRFRGADIHSYFEARNSADHQLTLRKNYRSHPDLVEEVNRIFSSRSRPFSLSAGKMEFQSVEPAKCSEDGALYLDGRELGVMHYCQLAPNPKDEKAGRWSSGLAAERFREFVVAETCRLLDREAPAMIRKSSAGETVEKPLQPRDVAVLVRSNRQADEYLQAFVTAGIPAIVASKKGVFETLEAKELYTLLQALAAPADSFRLKAAMTISWFNLTGNELQDIWEDDDRFDSWFNNFLLYSQKWQEVGFLSMMSGLLPAENVYVNIAGSKLAERRIANIHHLLELVQEAETNEKLGPEQTLIWLKSMLAGEALLEDRELRLESDEEAVRIVTMHSSKGLQYPVVFCPVLWYSSGRLRNEKQLVSCHDDNNELIIDLGSPLFGECRERAIAEELAEDLRLVYVALTRAELRCYTMWADVKKYGNVADSFSSALGYLLFPEGMTGPDVQRERFSSFSCNPGVEHSILEDVEHPAATFTAAEPTTVQLSAMQPGSRSLHTDYQMSSYSAMASLSEYEDHGREVVEPGAETGEYILHRELPAGANFGNLVHDGLELFSFAGLGEKRGNRQELSRLCTRYGLDLEAETVESLLATIVNTRLFPDEPGRPGFSLSQLAEERCIKEMGFYYHVNRLQTERINKVLESEPTVVPLSYKLMQGYLTGFVDLVCQHDGKFYILDYKTNFLGERLGDYSSEKLVQAMSSHNYGLQYWIYTLVLHNHLENVLADYRYETHFGGVMYLFVRGMNPENPGGGVFSTRPSLEVLESLDRAVGGDL